MTEEIWKSIPGYNGAYLVSNLGRVHNGEHLLKPQMQNSGYLVVHLYCCDDRKVYLVHRLVAAAFCERTGGEFVNHKDGRKTHNAAVNLEWVTRSENMRHAVVNGLAYAPRKAVIGTHNTSGEEVKFNSQLAAEVALTGRASSAIHHCLNGKKKSAYGYTWRRA